MGTRAEGSRLTISHLDESVSPILASLIRAGVGVEEVRKDSRSLEDVYLDLVKEEGRQV
jgi:ABC-2 type transport system ATP-binding protein